MLFAHAPVPCSLQSKHVSRELKRLGLKWGALPPSLLPKLRQLYAQYQGIAGGARYEKIAEELPGGWSNKQVGTQMTLSAQQGQHIVKVYTLLAWTKYKKKRDVGAAYVVLLVLERMGTVLAAFARALEGPCGTRLDH